MGHWFFIGTFQISTINSPIQDVEVVMSHERTEELV